MPETSKLSATVRSFERLQPVLEWLLDLIFPAQCSRCGKLGHYLCFINNKTKPLVEYFTHRKRGLPRAKSRGWYLNGIVAAFDYKKDEALREAIAAMKYHSVPEIAQVLANALWRQLGYSIDRHALVVPVPLHFKRLKYRGFNQATLIAEVFGNQGFQVEEMLVRKLATQTQTELDRKDRAKNVAGAFAIIKGKKPLAKGRTIFLVDDVATTGSTLNAAARAFKKAGAKKVFGLVVARD